jgi:multiple antibiotic resistance protein
MLRELIAETSGFLLLAFPALFSIINPLGGAFIFLAVTRHLSNPVRKRLALKVAIYSFATLTASMLIGAFVLKIFGISVPVLRVAGGIVIALAAWKLLNAEDDSSERGDVLEEASERDADHLAFYPLTMPMTTGPGTISVAIALGTGGAAQRNPLVSGIEAVVTATLMGLLIYIFYRSSSQISRAVGATGTAIIARLTSFLLFCIGIQMLWTGVAELLASLK